MLAGKLAVARIAPGIINSHRIRLTHYALRKLNTSPASLDEKDVLKKPLCTPMVKKIDLHFPLGLEVTARNLKGVTIKDALDAIYKQFKKKVCCPLSHMHRIGDDVPTTLSDSPTHPFCYPALT